MTMQLQEKMGKSSKIYRVGWISVLFFTQAHAGCFDFSKPITEPLRAPVTSDQSGNLPQGVGWAAVHGVIDAPIGSILKDLVQHRSTKSPRVNKMQISDLHDPNYLVKQEARFEVDPFPFVSVKWTEIWAFALTQGTPEKPDRVVVSYEKTQGTSHIDHLCGNYVLQRLGENKTDVFIYEEAKATGREIKDTLNGLKGNLRAFEKLK